MMTRYQKAENIVLFAILGIAPLLFCNQTTYMFPQVLSPHLLLAQLYHRAGFITKAVSELQFIIEAEPKIMSDEVITVKQDAQLMLSRSFGIAR